MRVLISHSTKDADLARVLSQFLKRSTTDRIEVWFSSDDSPTGGLQPGVTWYDKLRDELSQTDLVLALITPNSIDAPWLYFETGFGAADQNKLIVPVYLGLKASEIGMPLSGYQLFDIGQTNSFKSFVSKVFSIANITYYKEVVDDLRNRCFEQIQKYERRAFSRKAENPMEPLEEVLGKLSELHRKVDLLQIDRPLPEGNDKSLPAYDIDFGILSSDGNAIGEFSISVISGFTCEDILNEVYYKISDLVKPFEYLQTWIIHDSEEKVNIVIREVAYLISATSLFPPGSSFDVKLLAAPYDPISDSIL